MKKKITIISIIAILTLISVTAKTLVNRHNFYEDALFIKSEESANVKGETTDLNQKAAELSQKTGISFNPQISKHYNLLIHYDNIIVYYNAINDGVIYKENTKKDSSKNRKIKIYIDNRETDKFLLNFALIHGLYEDGRFEAVWQIKWKKSPLVSKQNKIHISHNNLAWEIANVNANVLLLYYDRANCWIEKKITPAIVYNVEYYPDYVTPFTAAESFSDNQLMQIWGTAFYISKPLKSNLLADLWFTLDKGNDFRYVIEWWSSEIMD